MVCDVCNKEYGRGQGYRGKRFAAQHFCSEDCYLSYVKAMDETKLKPKPKPQPTQKNSKELKEYHKLLDYLNELYDNPNWPWLMRQINSIKKQYELSDKAMYLIIKYAIEYEDVIVQEEMGLGQFFPRYIEPCQDFLNSLRLSQEKSSNFDFNEQTYVVGRSKTKSRKFREK